MKIISGQFKNRPLAVPKGLATRPSSGRLRESLFNICQNEIEGAKFLDLFSGSGAIGLEALSRGASSVTFVESSKEAIRCIEKNIQNLQVEKYCKVMFGDVFANLDRLCKFGEKFDIIFADPPYQTDIALDGVKMPFSSHVIRKVDEGDLLKEGGLLFVEESSECPDNTAELEHLKLKSSRRMGHSMLQQFIKIKSKL